VTALILASASPVRAQLLRAAGLFVEALPAGVDEEGVTAALLAEGVNALGVADALAELKALKVSARRPGSLVLGCDQVLVFEGRLVGKSADMAEARALLQAMRGKPHELISAAVLARDGAAIWRHQERASLSMRAFGDGFVDAYLGAEGEDLLSSVGCYRLEGLGAQLFERVEGDYFSILGLPLLAVLAALREQGLIQR